MLSRVVVPLIPDISGTATLGLAVMIDQSSRLASYKRHIISLAATTWPDQLLRLDCRSWMCQQPCTSVLAVWKVILSWLLLGQKPWAGWLQDNVCRTACKADSSAFVYLTVF